LRGGKHSRKDSDPLHCELVDIHVEGPQENEAMLTQPLKQIRANRLADADADGADDDDDDDDVVEIARPAAHLNGDKRNSDTAV
jgi:hypothetical protein